MAERITITPQELYDASKMFGDKASEIAQILQALQQEVNSLESTWDGAAQDQFFILYDEMAPQVMQMATDVLPGISDTLKGIADTLVNTDDELANQLRG